MLAALVGGGWVVWTYLYPSAFEPVALSAREQPSLDAKLQRLGLDPQDLMPDAERPADEFDADGRLIPERYTERDASRDISLSERELNAIVASSPELASRLAIDLADDLASAKLLIPVDPDFPVMGGRIIRVTAGMEIAYRGGRPVAILKGVSVMGVPVPNAWLGDLKNVDLVEHFSGAGGFWQSIARGLDHVEVRDGELQVRLKE